MKVAARVYQFCQPYTEDFYHVVAHMDIPEDGVPEHIDLVARDEATRLAESHLGGPAMLVEVFDWNASQLAIFKGMMARGIRPELN